MKNRIREKIIASVMLSAFAVTNLASASFALDGVYGGFDDVSSRPLIRSTESAAPLDLGSNLKISNADSVVNLSLRDANIKQVLRMFADQAGMNIIFSPNLEESTVTMDLVNIPLSEALNLVVTTNNLFYDIEANTLIISKKDEALSMAKKGMTLIPVKYVNANAIATFLNTNIFNKDGINPGLSIKPVVTTNPATNELIVMGTSNDADMARKIVAQFDIKPQVTTFKVNHTTPAEMANMICSSLLPSTASNGSTASGSSSSSGGGGDSSSASSADTPAGFAAGIPTGFASDDSGDDGDSGDSGDGGGDSSSSSGITVGGGKLVCSVDASAPSADGMAGLSLKSLSVSYFPTLGTIQVIGGSQTQLDMIRDYILANDKKTPQAYLEVQIIALTESGSKTFDNTWQFLSKNFSFNAGGGKGFSTDSAYPVFLAGHGYYTRGDWDEEKQDYGTTGKVGKWSGSPQLVYAVNYLVENEKGRVLANPRIMITSGQKSVIDLTSDYVAKVTSQYLDNGSSSGSAQAQKEYEIKNDNGIKVEITPFISPDGYVTLDLKPQYATIASQLTSPGEVEGERDIVATLLQRRNLDLKGIRIKDGETLVVGGMIQETETKNVSKIPFLGDLPVVGMFFRSTTTAKKKEEMVMMITPQIVVDTEDAVSDDTSL